jgi:NAD(P)-dependent dehydrogenase (short-subunit alcohol dehydrogenase family)
MRYVISGASRGIGLEFVRQLLARGETVVAGARVPSAANQLNALGKEAGNRLRIHQLDVTDPNSIRAFSMAVNEEPIDVLINNAGLSGKWVAFQEIDYEDMAQVMQTNALGPMRLSAAMLPALLRSPTRKIVNLTTRMASMADNNTTGVYGFAGGAYPYRMSKAALHAGMRTLAVDYRDHGLIAVVLSPGWVQTDMGSKMAPMRVEESVQGMLRVIDGLTLESNGGFFDFQGRECPW